MKTGQHLSIRRKHTATEAGRALLAMVRTISEDGRLTDEEALDLHRWLTATVTGDLPAAEFLRDVVGRALADGKITDEERREIHDAVIRVLPPDERRGATDARAEVFAQGSEARQEEQRQKKMADREKDEQEWEVQRNKDKQEWKAQRRAEVREAGMWEFVAAGVDYEGRAAVVASSMDEGTPVQLVREPLNKFDSNAISVQLWDGRSIGFVPKEVAAELAPYLDAGALAIARCTRLLNLGDIDRPLLQMGLIYLDGAKGLPGSPLHDWAAGFREKVPRANWAAAIADMKVKAGAQVGPGAIAALAVPRDLLGDEQGPATDSSGSSRPFSRPRSEELHGPPLILGLVVVLALAVAIVVMLAKGL